MGGRASAFTVASQRRAVRAVESGQTWRSVADAWRISTGLLSRWRRKYGKKPTHPSVVRDAREQYHSIKFKRQAVRELLVNRVPLMTLAKRLKVSDTTLRLWRRTYGKRRHRACPCCRCYVIK